MKDSEIRMATVYLHAPSGRSLLTEHPTAAEITAFLPSLETLTHVKKTLANLGFSIEATGVSLSISGPVNLFKKHCTAKEIAGRQLWEIKQLSRYIEAIEFSIQGKCL